MITEGYAYIHPKVNPTKVLGCAGGSTAKETPIVIYHVDGTDNQKWHWTKVPIGGGTHSFYYTFTPHHAENRGFDTNNGDNNVVWLWTYDPDNYNQRFALYPEDAANGWYSLHRWGDGHTVVTTASTENSQLTCINGYTGTENGWFSFEPITVSSAKASATPVEIAKPESVPPLKKFLADLRAASQAERDQQQKGAEKGKTKKAAKKKAPAKAKKVPAAKKKAPPAAKASGKPKTAKK